MSGRLRASVIVIGDEILGGYVQDSNSGWLAQRFQAHGVPLDRVVTVPDEVAEIVEALRSELERSRPRVVVTSGGVGSTPDDVTYEAVAAALAVGVVVAPALQERITAILQRTASAGVAVPDHHAAALQKMAQVPEGAYLLGGDEVTPGVAVDVDGGLEEAGATVVALPGIPSELRRITRESLEPRLLAGRGQPQHVVELRHPFPESVLNPALMRIVTDFPDVHLGSYPGPECVVRLKGPQERVEAAAVVVGAAIGEVGRMPGADRLSRSWQAHWQGEED